MKATTLPVGAPVAIVAKRRPSTRGVIVRDQGEGSNGDLEGSSILGLHMTMCCWQMMVPKLE